MKLAVKIAGLCASGAFLVTSMPAFFGQVAPLGLSAIPLGTIQGMEIIETILFSLIGSLMAGVIGYIIGDILAHPQGAVETGHSASKKTGKHSSGSSDPGDETFLADLEPITITPFQETADTTANMDAGQAEPHNPSAESA